MLMRDRAQHEAARDAPERHEHGDFGVELPHRFHAELRRARRAGREEADPPLRYGRQRTVGLACADRYGADIIGGIVTASLLRKNLPRAHRVPRQHAARDQTP